MRAPSRSVVVAAAAATLLTTVAVVAFLLGTTNGDPSALPTGTASASVVASSSPEPPAPRQSLRADPDAVPMSDTEVVHVVAISVDGLNVDAIEALGSAGTPTLHRLMREGAATLNARTAYERSITLPNHTGMVTGRRIDRAAGGHGVTWNLDLPDDTVQQASGEDRVQSIFSVAHAHGDSTALFAGKAKFDIFPDSWPGAIDTTVFKTDPAALASAAADYLVDRRPTLTFVHLANPDLAGHAFGGMSAAYLSAVAVADQEIGTLVAAIESDPDLRDHTAVIVTADHGFARGAHLHAAPVPANYTVPFVVWGAGVDRGDLYRLNPDRRDPGTGRPAYDGAQPIRNLDLANLSMSMLGLPTLEGSVDRRPIEVTRR